MHLQLLLKNSYMRLSKTPVLPGCLGKSGDLHGVIVTRGLWKVFCPYEQQIRKAMEAVIETVE